MRVLILGGTAEARQIAQALVETRVPVISSLAGRVSRPRLPVGEVRVGGFGGAAGLAEFIRSDAITHVVDATHPFATTMTRHGVEATDTTGTPFVRYARPGWRTHPQAHRWTWVRSYEQARDAADRLGTTPFLTTGRQTLGYFADAWAGRDVLARVVEPLEQNPPAGWRILLDRGPYDVDGELELLGAYGIDVLLAKDSGGSYTAAKLDAATRLGVPVVVVARPEVPSGATEVSTLGAALSTVLSPG